MLTALKSSLRRQQVLFSSFIEKTGTMTETSFIVSWNVTGAKRQCTDGDIVKKNIYEVISVLYSKSAILQRLN
jgi:hypothetical protein